jgi:hypothetical protein
MADDDSHELTNVKDVCRSFNLVNSDLLKDSVLKALGTGRSVGVKFNISTFKTNEEKRAALPLLPEINVINFINDTLTVRLSHPVKTIKFIGQHGVEKKIITNSSGGSYAFSKQDTYIRTEIECKDGTVYYLNPLLRYDGIRLTYYNPTVNLFKTRVWRSVVFISLLIFIIWYRRRCTTAKK